MKTLAFLWGADEPGLYFQKSVDELYRMVGHNTGNLAFFYAIRNQIAGQFMVCSWNFDPAKLSKVDAIIIPCANQLGPHTNLQVAADRLLAVGKPVVAIGLGAQAASMDADIELNEGTRAWVDAINRLRVGKAPNIYTRGPYTSSQLARFGVEDSMVGGCPSHFISPEPRLGERIHAHWTRQSVPRAISVAAGHQGWASLRTIEQQLVALMQDPVLPGQYVVQAETSMLHIAHDSVDQMDPEKFEAVRRYIAPQYSTEEFRNWCRCYARAFYDIPSWMDSLRRFDLTIGPRYHGVALALQAERMGATVALDSRTEEMCIQTGIPHFRRADLESKAITRANLRKWLKFDPKAYDRQRLERAQNYVRFLESNELTPTPHLYQLAKVTAPKAA